MKNVLQTIILFSFLLFGAGAMASSCQIVLGGYKPCAKPTGVAPDTLFQDGDALAQASPKRCAQRAKEYYRWCQFGPYENWVGAYYHNDRGLDFAVTTDGVKEYFYTTERKGHFIHVGTGKVEK